MAQSIERDTQFKIAGGLDPDQAYREALEEVDKWMLWLKDGQVARLQPNGIIRPTFSLNVKDPFLLPGETSNDINGLQSYESFKASKVYTDAGYREWIRTNTTLFDVGATKPDGSLLSAADRAGYSDGDFVRSPELARKLEDQKVSNILGRFIADEDGSVDRKTAFDALLLSVAAVAVMKIAADRNQEIQDYLRELAQNFDLEFDADLIKSAGESLFVGLGQYGALALLAGGAGPALKLALEATLAYEDIADVIELVAIAFPDWDLIQAIDAVADQAGAAIGKALQFLEKELLADTLIIAESSDPAAPRIVEGGEGAQFMWGRGSAVLRGGDGDDYMLHTGFGELRGEDGGDVLIGWASEFKDGAGLTLDGGIGDDWVIALGGEGAITVGGVGRDFVFNTSAYGQLYGDTVDGQGASSAGETDSDVFWHWPGTFVMDARPNDLLQLFGFPLLGGTNVVAGAAAGDGSLAMDWLFPFVFYGATTGGQLLVVNALAAAMDIGLEGMKGVMVVEDYDFGGWDDAQWGRPAPGDLGMTFRIARSGEGSVEISRWNAVWGELFTRIDVLFNFAKAIRWRPVDDPLVIDLDGDGIETTSALQSGVHFDFDGDFFAEKAGWLSADDGFIVMDRNGNGRIDDVSEMFGGPGRSGFADLAGLDENGDGAVTIADEGFAGLRVWRDLDQDGLTDAGELKSLAEHGIASLGTGSSPIDSETPQGNRILAGGSFTRADGASGALYDMAFDADPTDTIFRGERGVAGWLKGGDLPDGKGFGSMTSLAVGQSNDFELREIVAEAAARADNPVLKDIREAVAPVFGAWAQLLDTTRELTPVLLAQEPDGATLVDRAIYEEDASGGYWRLKSGAPVLEAGGAAIPRPTLEQVLAQEAGEGQAWRLEQMFSPSSRGEALQHREPAPYLAKLIDGRVVVLDHGVENPDGSWRLASGRVVTGADGLPIAAPNRADIMATAAGAGEEWRSEALGFNPFADLDVDRMAVYLVDGKVVDYSVQVTDADGAFDVWARNLDRALELQHKLGQPGEFQLRNYAIELETLPEAQATEDSAYRVEVLSAGQFHFATSAYGIDFQPEVMAARIDPATGRISYSAGTHDGSVLPDTDSDGSYRSAITGAIELMALVVENYVTVSRAFSVRIALQGGLKDYARGLGYDAQSDKFFATSDRELAPMFEAIFENAPDGFDATMEYLAAWDEILEIIYPDYKVDSGANFITGAMRVDEAFLAQMVLAAFENVPLDIDLAAAFNVLGVDETKLIQAAPDADEIAGTSGADYIYVSGAGAQVYNGGAQADIYLVGKDIGSDTIADVDDDMRGEKADQIRFAQAKSTDIRATRDGHDLVLSVIGTDDVLRVRDQFLGDRIDPLFGFNFAPATQIGSIIFADGVIWDRLQIAQAVSHPLDSDDVVIGSQSRDYLEGGKGNDIVKGGRDGDIYVFRQGDGDDRYFDDNDWWSDRGQDKYDFLQLGQGLGLERLKFHRAGESDDVEIAFLGEDGAPTGDGLVIEGQFFWANAPILGLMFPYRIEAIGFADGGFLQHTDVMARVLQDMKTDGADVIYGFNNADTLDGGEGDDLLVGRAQDDAYIYGRSYGVDVIHDQNDDLLASSYDTLTFTDGLRWTDFIFEREGASSTVAMRVNGTSDRVILKDAYNNEFFLGFVNLIEELNFSDGTVWDATKLAQHFIDLASTDGADTIYGFDIANIHDGGAGDDRIEGMGGDDGYVYARGYGDDTILDTSSGEAGDTLTLRGVALDDVVFERAGDDLILRIRDTGERLTLENQYLRDAAQAGAIETFVFSDITIDFTQINPEDVDLVGTSASETLIGTDFAEVIDGRAGDDTLVGGSDGDAYRFDVGYGEDVIIDRQVRAAWTGRNLRSEKEGDDSILFGDDVTIDNAVFTKDGEDLLISITDRTDTLRIRNQFRDIEDQIEWFVFADGTRWHASDIEERLAIVGGGRGDDRIEGVVDNPNVFDGRQGDDELIGGRAGDTYAFGAQYNLDVITERQDGFAGAIDRVVFGAAVSRDTLEWRRDGDNLLIGLGNGEDQLTIVQGFTTRAVEEFLFADGTLLTIEEIRDLVLTGSVGDDVLIGFDGRGDILNGGAGSDSLVGGSGDDTYQFGLGSGDDSVLDSGGVERIEFGPGVTADMIEFSDENGDLLVTLAGGADTLIIFGGSRTDASAFRIERFVFEDGGEISGADVLRQLVLAQASGGHDVIDARIGSAITVAGGKGDDLIILGADGVATFKAGDGLDVLDTLSATGATRLVFEDLDSTDAVVRRADLDGADLIISFPQSGDQVIVRGALTSARTPRIEFADGVTWDRATLVAAAVNAQMTGRSDAITGSSLADTIAGGAGDDDIEGGSGDDVYRFERGDGRDVIADSSGTDRLDIRGYRPEEVAVSRPVADRQDILLTFGGSSDQILLRFGPSGAAGVETVTFGDGTVWTRQALFDRAIGQGTDYGDAITGTDSDNVIAGGEGADLLSGRSGDDTYIYARGDGRDIINDAGASSDANRLLIRDYVPADVVVIRAEDRPNDLILRFSDADEIVVIGGFVQNGSHIAQLTFENGTSWTMADILFRLEQTRPRERAETVIGTAGTDTIVGHQGDDYLSGRGGGDTYVFNRGDGRDVIDDYGDANSAIIDAIHINGFTADGARFERSVTNPSNLVIRFPGSNDQITIVGGIDVASGRIERVVFGDSAVLSHADILARVLSTGTDGDDVLQGTAAAETISGGAGRDTLIGGDGSDTYIFRNGDGQDTIEDNGAGDADIVRIEGYASAQARLSSSAIAGDALVVRFEGSGDALTINNTLASDHGDQIEQIAFSDGVTWTMAQIKAALVAQQASDGADRIVGFNGGDTINGGLGDDRLAGGDGSDTYLFSRGDGQDVIRDDGVSDTDALVISGYGASDIVFSRDPFVSDRLVVSFPGSQDRIAIENTLDGDFYDQIEQIRLADGSRTWSIAEIKGILLAQQASDGADRIVGFNGGDTINGGLGDDRLAGGDGSDTYLFSRGDGQDVIRDDGVSDTDALVISGYGASDIVFSRDPFVSDRLVVSFAGTDDSIVIANTLDGDYSDQIEQIRLADGSKTWSIAEVKELLLAQQANDGADRVVGFNSADTIDGGPGDDRLTGGDGSDTYLFARGDGRDVIVDQGLLDTDALVILGYEASEITFSRDPDFFDRLVITFAGTQDQITIQNTLDGDAYDQIEQIRLADGSKTWSMAQVIAALEPPPVRAPVTGTAGGDVLSSTAARELLDGGRGDDTYVYARGDGDDIIDDTDAFGSRPDILRIEGVAPADVTISRRGAGVVLEIAESAPGAGDGGRILVRQTLDPYLQQGVETIVFDDGTEWTGAMLREIVFAQSSTAGDDVIDGTGAADALTGGAGDDILDGRGGADQYVYRRGDGHDIVDDGDSFDNSVDTLVLQDVTQTSVTLERYGSHLRIHVAESADGAGDAGSVVLKDLMDPYFRRGVEVVRFADGAQWTAATMRQMVIDGETTDGNDRVVGATGNETFAGGLGDDVIYGGEGDDTFFYARGDGYDILDETADLGGYDRLILQGVEVGDVRVERDGGDAILAIAESAPGAGDGGRILLKQVLNPYFERGIETIRFDDGAEWTQATLRSFVVSQAASDGDDIIAGTSGDDAFDASGGDDRIVGWEGDDAYLYSRGDGDDVIVESETRGGVDDRLVFTDILPADVTARIVGNHIILTIRESAPEADDGGEIALLDSAQVYYDRGVERVVFADFSEWRMTELQNILVRSSQTDGDDRVTGTNAADTLEPGLGEDFVRGLEGDDTYVFRAGDGRDVIDDNGWRGLDTLRIIGYAPDKVLLSRQAYPADTLLVQFEGSDDSITIVNTLNDDPSDQIEQFVFDDGVVWTTGDIRARLIAQDQSGGDDNVRGFDGADTLEPGAGNDVVSGGRGLDTYVYNRGDGADIILDDHAQNGDVLRLVGVEPSSVILSRGVGEDLELMILPSAADAADGGRLTLRDSFLATRTLGVETILFDDGTVWSRPEFETLAQRNIASAGDDLLTGTSGADRLEGLAGADTMTGGLGDDVFVFTRGDGQDTIRDAGGGVDRIEIAGYAPSELEFSRRGRDGQDLIIRFSETDDTITVINGLLAGQTDRIETLVLTDTGDVLPIEAILSTLTLGEPSSGSDQIIGTALDDRIEAGAGSDLMLGFEGDDTYVWRRGDGDDRIKDSATSSADRLHLVDVDSTAPMSAARSPANGLDLVLRFGDGEDRIILADTLGGDGRGVEEIRFADGIVWGVAQMRAAVLASAASDGDETIRGFDGADTLRGGVGDNLLIGDMGADTYVHRAGDGRDTIDDRSNSAGDRLLLENIVSSEAGVRQLYKGSDAVVLSFATAGGQVTLRGMLSDNGGGIEEIVFSDGVTWTRQTLIDLLANDAPVAVKDGILAARQDQALIIDPRSLLRNDYDADGDFLRIVSVNGGDRGSAQIDDSGMISFLASPGFVGSAQMTYTISDGRGGLSTGVVDIRVSPLALARDDAGFTVAEDGFLSIDARRLLSNDADGDRMIVSQVKDAIGGQVSLASNGQISFTPATNYNGPASFTYVANTPEGGRTEAQVAIVVSPVNDAPVARDDRGFQTLEGQSLVISRSALLDNDSDIDGDALTISAVSGDGDVDASITETGDLLIIPTVYYFGTANVTYQIADGRGGFAMASIEIDVVPVNDAPLTAVDRLTIDEDHPILIAAADLLGNDADPDGDVLSISSVRAGYGGAVTLYDNQTVLFTPWADFNGQAWFRYTASDGNGGVAEQRVDVQVEPLNDAPVARDESYLDAGRAYLRGVEDTAIIIPFVELLNNDSDVDSLTLRLETIAYSENGAAEILENGDIRFTPNENYWGVASFRYVVSDAEGLVDDGLVTLYFDPVADGPPVAQDDVVHVYEDVPTIIPAATLLANDTDVDRDPLTIVSAVRALGGHGAVSLTETGDILFTPALNSTAPSAFAYTVSDGADGEDTASVEIVIVPVNDAPNAAADNASTTLDVPLVLRISDLMANDGDVDLRPADFDLLRFVGVNSSAHGAASVYNDEFIVVDYAPGFAGVSSLEYTIADPEGVEDDGTVTVGVADTIVSTIAGGQARDLLIGSHRGETIDGLGGDDDLFGREGDDILVGGDGADRVDGGDGFDVVRFTGSNIGVRADLAARIGQGGHAQGDIYLNVEALSGTDSVDELAGDAGANTLEGLGGADLLSGREGDDTLIAGAGDDTLDGGEGADLLDGGEGGDTADYSRSASAIAVSLALGAAAGGDADGDTLLSIENLTGSDFDDDLGGNAGANVLSGGRGDDRLDGGDGDDRLVGGRGADQLIGGDGVDIADYSGSAEGVIVNMVDGAAGGGDAHGDTFSSIETVVGSFHDDAITGDAADNIIRGGRGADAIDGGDGLDTADYSEADEAVAVDLTLGQGFAGEADGDTLVNIERLTGSAYGDVLRGGAADDVLDGRFGNDMLEGRAGSDTYLFGYDSGEDIVIEAGEAGDVDRIVMQADVRPADVSVIRQGDDLLIELERDDGLLIDTLRVVNHFLTAQEGVEEIVFANGATWDRDLIDALSRTGRFNASDDVIRFATEDVAYRIEAERLLANDAETSEGLRIVGVENPFNATVSLNVDGSVQFLGAPDHNGDAFFDYVVRDAFGRESRARAEVNVLPVNDAPVAADDGVFAGIEDTALFMSLADLIGNDLDVDGDELTIVSVGPLLGPDGEPLYQDFPGGASNGRALRLGDGVAFEPTLNHYGFAGFTYTIADQDGLTSTASFTLHFTGVNDAPDAGIDRLTARLGRTLSFSADQLVANDIDPEDDPVSFVRVVSLDKGGYSLREEDGVQYIDFDGADLGKASLVYEVADSLGAVSVGVAEINVIPLNDPPNARNDSGFTTLEDVPLVIDPGTLLANDSDPNDDILTIVSLQRFPNNGEVSFNSDGMIVFTPKLDFNGAAGFEYTVSDGQGGLDTAYVSITVEIDNDGPVLRDDVLSAREDIPILVLAGEAFGNDLDPEGDFITFADAVFLGVLTDDFTDRDEHLESVELASPILQHTTGVSAKLTDGQDLPIWLSFDAQALRFTGAPPAGLEEPLDVRLTFTASNPLTGEDAVWEDDFTIDPADPALQAQGAAYDAGLAAMTVSRTGGVTALLASGRELPQWLSFDAQTGAFSRTGIEPLPDESVARVRVNVTPDDATREPFAVEVSIDPHAPIDPAVNALFAQPDYFRMHGLFVLPAGTDAAISAAKANGFALPSWLAFDPESLTFSGAPPQTYVGTVEARVDVGATVAHPAFSLITDIVIDQGFSLATPPGFTILLDDGQIQITTPEDFFGSFAVAYDAVDVKGAVSEDPGVIVINVSPERERPDAGFDAFTTAEDTPVTIAIADLLANDRDDDGDAIRILSVDSSENGGVSVATREIAVDTPPPAGLDPANTTHVARLVDGSPLPDWLSIDGATGRISGRPPLDALLNLAILVTSSDGAASVESAVSLDVDGNVGALVTFTPARHFSGDVPLAYVLTDDREGPSQSEIKITVTPANDPPIANEDTLAGLEDNVLVIDAATLLANDTDVDGDALSVVSVLNAVNGTVELADGRIWFTPDANFDGVGGFDYVATDGTDGNAIGHVTINVASTTRAPQINIDRFETAEDTPLIVRAADLLANDVDPDGDPISFVTLTAGQGAQAFRLPNGDWQLTPRDNINGEVSFAYSITDGRLATERQGAIVLNVTPVNDAPAVIGETGFVTNEDAEIRLRLSDLLANDSDVDGDAISIVAVGDPVNGSVVIEGDEAVFTPREDYFGNAGFSYSVSDGRGGVTSGFAAITVLTQQDLPIAAPDEGWVIDEDGFIEIDPAELLANDNDPDGDALTFLSASGPGVTITPQGMIRFAAPTDAFGAFTLSYAIADASGLPVTGAFMVRVLPVEDAPQAVDDELAGLEDEALIIPLVMLVANDTDADRQDIDIVALSAASGGTVAFDGAGNIVFTPDADLNGEASFAYTLSDVTGLLDEATVTIRLAARNDAPTIATFGPLVTAEDAFVAHQLPASAFADLDGDQLALSVTLANGDPLPSWLTYNPPTRSLTGQPPQNFNGRLDLAVTASDGQAEAVRAFQLVVTPVNDAPVALGETLEGGGRTFIVSGASLLANDSDVDGDPLTIVAVAASEGVEAQLDGRGDIIVTRPGDYEGDVVLTYTVSDGGLTTQAQAAFSVTAINEPPVIAPIADIRMDEDTALAWRIPDEAISDADGDALIVLVNRTGGVALPYWLSFDASTRTLTGSPPANFFGVIPLEVTASDGETTTASSINLVIDAVNDAPSLSAPFSDRYVAEDAPFDIRLQQGLFSDIDGDDLTFQITALDGSTLPDWISVDDAALRLHGLPPVNFTGAVDVRISASDGRSTISDAFKLHVTPTNDSPVLSQPLADVGSVDGEPLKTGVAFSIAIPAATFTDPDGDPLQFAARLANGEALPGWMSFDGSKISGVAPFAAAGDYDIEILASDGEAQNSDVFRITIQPGNAAPVANPDGVFTVYQPQSIRIPVEVLLANDADANGDDLTITAVAGAEHGQVSIADGVVTYTPQSGYVGADQFTYTLSDGKTASSGAVRLNVDATYAGYRQGSSGEDTLIGGILRGDQFGGAGDDTMIASLLGGNVAGGQGNDTLVGLIGTANLEGNEGDDRLIGGLRADRLSGGTGDDTLTGGFGRDTFVFRDGDGSDTINDFNAGRRARALFIGGDTIEIDVSGVESFADMMSRASQTDGGVLFDFGNGDDLFLQGTLLAALDRDSFTFV